MRAEKTTLESHKDNLYTKCYTFNLCQKELNPMYDYLMSKLEIEKEIWLKKHDSVEEVVEYIKENYATLKGAVIPKRASN